MHPLTHAIPYTIFGLLAVTILCTVGAYTSRRFSYNFMYLSIISFFIYMGIGYFVTQKTNLSVAILSSLIVGFYDATVGWKLSLIFKANMQVDDELLESMTPTKGLTIMLFVAPLFTFIGSLFI